MSEVHHAAAQAGQASPAMRLDPPLLMGLGKIAQVCPVPLPSWLADSGGKGIQVIAIAHGQAQLAARWHDHGAQAVWDTSSVKVFLPGITDVTTLDAASRLCGQAAFRVRHQPYPAKHEVATPDMIRQLPGGHALVIRGGCAPVITKLPQAWRSPAFRHARRLTARGRAVSAVIAPGQPAPALRPAAAWVPHDLPGTGPDVFPWN